MRVSIFDATDTLQPAELIALEQRLRFLLTRFTDRIASVRLSLQLEQSEVYVCRGTVTLQDGGQQRAEDRGTQLFDCGARVADRLGRAVARSVELQQRDGRSSARRIQR